MEVLSTFWYLKNLPLYETTKPYIVNLPPSYIPAGKRTNQECAAYQGIRVHDLRTAEQNFTLDRHGFEHSKSIPMSLKYEEFFDPVKVEKVYCESIKATLLEKTGAESARLLHHAVRVVLRALSHSRAALISGFMGRSAVVTSAFPNTREGVKKLTPISPYKAFIVVST